MPLKIRGAHFNSECTISAGNTPRIGPAANRNRVCLRCAYGYATLPEHRPLSLKPRSDTSIVLLGHLRGLCCCCGRSAAESKRQRCLVRSVADSRDISRSDEDLIYRVCVCVTMNSVVRASSVAAFVVLIGKCGKYRRGQSETCSRIMTECARDSGG